MLVSPRVTAHLQTVFWYFTLVNYRKAVYMKSRVWDESHGVSTYGQEP